MQNVSRARLRNAILARQSVHFDGANGGNNGSPDKCVERIWSAIIIRKALFEFDGWSLEFWEHAQLEIPPWPASSFAVRLPVRIRTARRRDVSCPGKYLRIRGSKRTGLKASMDFWYSVCTEEAFGGVFRVVLCCRSKFSGLEWVSDVDWKLRNYDATKIVGSRF